MQKSTAGKFHGITSLGYWRRGCLASDCNRAYSALIFASRMMRPYSSYCLRRCAPKSTPHIPTGKSPRSTSFRLISGACNAAISQPANWEAVSPRCFCRSDHSEPTLRLVVPVSGLSDGRHVRNRLEPRPRSGSERAQLAGLHLRDHVPVVGDSRRHMSTQKCVDRRSAAGIRNEGHIDVGHALESLERDVRTGCWSDGGKRQFAGLGACRVEQVGEHRVRRCIVDDDEMRRPREMADWLETKRIVV
jgi:hypothetical protein